MELNGMHIEKIFSKWNDVTPLRGGIAFAEGDAGFAFVLDAVEFESRLIDRLDAEKAAIAAEKAAFATLVADELSLPATLTSNGQARRLGRADERKLVDLLVKAGEIDRKVERLASRLKATGQTKLRQTERRRLTGSLHAARKARKDLRVSIKETVQEMYLRLGGAPMHGRKDVLAAFEEYNPLDAAIRHAAWLAREVKSNPSLKADLDRARAEETALIGRILLVRGCRPAELTDRQARRFDQFDAQASWLEAQANTSKSRGQKTFRVGQLERAQLPALRMSFKDEQGRRQFVNA